ncbi:Agmatinase [Anoxybacillus sp. BCO1]|nr:Agmatinase [Anoxybacillus sp. BCO1]
MRFDEAYSGNVFIKSHPNFEESQAVIYGMPMDWTVSYRPGSRFGPARIREVSIGLEEYSPYLDRELDEVKYFDAGDIPLPFGNAQRSLDMIEQFVDRILEAGKFPLGLGGEHLVSWPVMKAVYKKYPDLAIIHMDAIRIYASIMKANRYHILRQFVKLLSSLGRKMYILSVFVLE